jgi:hypothetical protein
MTEKFHEEFGVEKAEGETSQVDNAPSIESVSDGEETLDALVESQSTESMEQSQELSLETVRILEEEEEHELLDLVAEKMSQEGGVSVTKEELLTSDDPELQGHFSAFLDQHPKMKNLLRAFTLATGLATAGCAQAGGVGQVLTQGVMNQVHAEMNAGAYRSNTEVNQMQQERYARLHAEQNVQRMQLQQGQERERFEVSRKSALRELMLRNPSNGQIQEFKVRWENQHAQMIQRQKEQMETHGLNARTQETQRGLNYQHQREKFGPRLGGRFAALAFARNNKLWIPHCH